MTTTKILIPDNTKLVDLLWKSRREYARQHRFYPDTLHISKGDYRQILVDLADPSKSYFVNFYHAFFEKQFLGAKILVDSAVMDGCWSFYCAQQKIKSDNYDIN